MKAKLTDTLIKERMKQPAPNANLILYDDGSHEDSVTGFGVRFTPGGSVSFILNYRFNKQERRYTIGAYGVDQWTLAAARKRAGALRKSIDLGIDPQAEKVEAREAPTVADLCKRFKETHFPKIRPVTQRDYGALIDNDILPAMRHLKVAAVTFTDCDDLHRKITKRGATYRANRAAAVLSKMFSLAIRWGWRSDNPAKGIERNQETKRHRYLSGDELGRLTEALASHPDKQAADIIRLLLLTGARRGEVLGARWDQLDLEAGVWTKPGSTTKQKTEHRVPLSAPARQLLADLYRDGAEYVFPGRIGGHRVEIKSDWKALCKAAKIKGARLHDLRHTYASVLASAGLSLPVIGALLGHSQPATTARYSHLFDDPLRAATERVGAIVTGGKSADVVTIGRRA